MDPGHGNLAAWSICLHSCDKSAALQQGGKWNEWGRAAGLSRQAGGAGQAGKRRRVGWSKCPTLFAVPHLPRLQGGSDNWDLCCGGDTAPDLFSEFYSAGSLKGKTDVRPNLGVTPGTSATLPQGTVRLWRGDATPGASATQAALGLDTVDWAEVEVSGQAGRPSA